MIENLVKDSWGSDDIEFFHQTLKDYSKGDEKAVWERRIVNTGLPCLAVPCTIVDDIAKKIFKGNYRQFLDIMPWEYHTDTQVIGKIINKIRDIDEYLFYLDKYVVRCDNWATTDVLRFPKKKEYQEKLYAKAKEYIASNKTFVKRVGLLILMKNFANIAYINDIFEILNKFEKEDEYYVLMMIAWLLCELVIKCGTIAVTYIKECSLCDFVINKTISKCLDSYRISKDDKEMLRKLRRNNIYNVNVNKHEYVKQKKTYR